MALPASHLMKEGGFLPEAQAHRDRERKLSGHLNLEIQSLEYFHLDHAVLTCICNRPSKGVVPGSAMRPSSYMDLTGYGREIAYSFPAAWGVPWPRASSTNAKNSPSSKGLIKNPNAPACRTVASAAGSS